MRIGLISDTHGYMGTDALAALTGCELILHAGDVGDGVLTPLRQLAPVLAVRGNNDTSGEAASLPEVERVEVGGLRIVVVHRLIDAPRAPEWDVLVFGHCHRQHLDEDGPRLLVNPGAAGRRGFHVARSIGVAHVDSGRVRVEFVDLGARAFASGSRRK